MQRSQIQAIREAGYLNYSRVAELLGSRTAVEQPCQLRKSYSFRTLPHCLYGRLKTLPSASDDRP